MKYETIDVRKVTGGCGAEILGIDLNALSNSQWSEVQRAFVEHGVVFFRDQKLTPEQHIAFARRWAPIDVNRFFKSVEGYPEIAEVRKEPEQKTNIGGGWHTDSPWDTEICKATQLYGIEIPRVGGNTMFADLYQAYETLSPTMKRMLEGLEAVHAMANAGDTSYGREFTGQADIVASRSAVHPLVITHPDSGRKALFVNRGYTAR